jgi:hypothetical protein
MLLLMFTGKEDAEALIDASKEDCLKVQTDQTKHIPTFRRKLNEANTSFIDAAKFVLCRIDPLINGGRC